MGAPGHEAEHVLLDDLTRRAPGHALMALCLATQVAAGSRTFPARLFGAQPLRDDSVPAYLGVLGERSVARMLEALGPEYVVLHSVPGVAPTDRIDHLVIGPMGVLAITTKRHREAKVFVAADTVLIGGRNLGYVHAARSASRRVRAVLASGSLPTTPVLSMVVIVDAAQVTTRQPPRGIEVLDARRLLRSVRRLTPALDHEAVWTLAAALSSAATWTDRNMADESDVPAAFAALEREVRAARAIRVAWAFVGCVVVASVAVGAAMLVPSVLGVTS